MELLDKIIEEYDRYVIGTLIGKDMSVSKLRKLCLEYNKNVPESFVISCSSDKEMLNDLKCKFREYISLSEEY